MDKLISIIIPIYNLEAYLKNCIDSVIAQTYKNLEIILVDDCSMDGSINICRAYEKKDIRIRVIEKKKNEGAGVARNAGIDIAQGQYIMFVDGDDFIAEDCVEQLYTALLKGGGDISVCLGKSVYNLKRIVNIEKADCTNCKCFDSQQAIENICYQRNITPGPCGKLFKIGLFNDLRFPNTGYEDMAIIYRLMDKANMIVFFPVEKYYYLQRKNNTTLGKFNKKKLDRILVAKQMMEFIENEYPDLDTCAKVRFFIANIQTLNVLPFRLLYSEHGKMISNNIIKYRGMVLGDRKAKISTRCMAFMSYTGMLPLKMLGLIYGFSLGGFKVRLK